MNGGKSPQAGLVDEDSGNEILLLSLEIKIITRESYLTPYRITLPTSSLELSAPNIMCPVRWQQMPIETTSKVLVGGFVSMLRSGEKPLSLWKHSEGSGKKALICDKKKVTPTTEEDHSLEGYVVIG